MLPAQVSYWTLQENKRHNLETERLGWSNYEETKRHNLTSEQLGFANLEENKRHNIVSEGVSLNTLAENIRHNKIGEGVAVGTLAEGIRHNVESERIGMKQATSSSIQARAAQRNASISASRLNIDYKRLPHELENLQMITETGYTNAAAHTKQAEASLQQAQAAEKNATTNQWRAGSEMLGKIVEVGIKLAPLFASQ